MATTRATIETSELDLQDPTFRSNYMAIDLPPKPQGVKPSDLCPRELFRICARCATNARVQVGRMAKCVGKLCATAVGIDQGLGSYEVDSSSAFI